MTLAEMDLWDLLNRQEAELTPSLSRLWEVIRILPERWKLHPWGDPTGGFWVVGLIGRRVIWYNEIEDGFEHSRFHTYGEIDVYQCSQFSLSNSLQRLQDILSSGFDSGPWTSGPYAGDYVSRKP